MAGMIWVESTLLKRILKHELNKDNTNKHARLDGRESPGGLNSTQKAIFNSGKLGAGAVTFPREAHTNWLSSTTWSDRKTYIQVIWTEHGLNMLL